MEKTLVLLKPDAIERGLAGAILARFESARLRVADGRMIAPDAALLGAHYAGLEKSNASAFRRTEASLAGRPFLAVVLRGPNAVRKARLLIGPTDPLAAPAGTIRGDFGNDTIERADSESRATDNLVHAADSESAARDEIALWFGGGAESV